MLVRNFADTIHFHVQSVFLNVFLTFFQGLCDMLIDRHEKGSEEENKAIVLSDIEVRT